MIQTRFLNTKYDQRPTEYLNGIPVASIKFCMRMCKTDIYAAAHYWAWVLETKRKTEKERNDCAANYTRPKKPLPLDKCRVLVEEMLSDFEQRPRYGFLTMSVFSRRTAYVKKEFEVISPGEWDRIKLRFHTKAKEYQKTGSQKPIGNKKVA